MLIHRQNSYAPRGKQRIGRREPVNRVKKLSVFMNLIFVHVDTLPFL
jgi:hypothetical protein